LFSIASMLGPSPAQVPRSSKSVKAAGRIWIPAGKFTVHVYAAGLVERRPGLTVDGRSLGSDESFTRPGYHNVVVADVRADDRVLAFIGTGASSQTLEPAKTIKYSTFDWRLTNERTSTLELASFEDGQWLLDDAETGRHVASGVRCDLVDTCFVDVPPGDYRVHHTWQPLLRFGFITTAVTAILAVSVLFASVALRRRALRGLPQKSILSLG
jgi:hypothetical protein